MLIKLHPFIKVESLPYLKMLSHWYLSLSCDGVCGSVVACLRVSRELGKVISSLGCDNKTSLLGS